MSEGPKVCRNSVEKCIDSVTPLLSCNFYILIITVSELLSSEFYILYDTAGPQSKMLGCDALQRRALNHSLSQGGVCLLFLPLLDR